MVKNEPGSQNIFNITEPAHYRCQRYHYHSRLSRLYVRIAKAQSDQTAFFVLFSDVGYIEAPINWQGADFTIAQPDDCIALLLETGLIGQAILQFPGAYASITDHARLYTVPEASHPIRIIASSASILQRLPADL